MGLEGRPASPGTGGLDKPVLHQPQYPQNAKEVSVCVGGETGCSLLSGPHPDSLGKL